MAKSQVKQAIFHRIFQANNLKMLLKTGLFQALKQKLHMTNQVTQQTRLKISFKKLQTAKKLLIYQLISTHLLSLSEQTANRANMLMPSEMLQEEILKQRLKETMQTAQLTRQKKPTNKLQKNISIIKTSMKKKTTKKKKKTINKNKRLCKLQGLLIR